MITCSLVLMLSAPLSHVVQWNTTFPSNDGHALVDAAFGWGKIYASLGSNVSFLDSATGCIISSEAIPPQGCYIWSSVISVIPLTQHNTAVVAGGNKLAAFHGTSFQHNTVWNSPEFDCPNLQSVGTKAVVVTNFTTYGIVNTASGSMWTLPYTTYKDYSNWDANLYLIEPSATAPLAVFFTLWPSFNASFNTTYAMYDGATGKERWRKVYPGMKISWFDYHAATDLLLEFNLPDLLQARDWRKWDAPPVWKAAWASSASYQSVLISADLVFAYGSPTGQVEALDVRTGKHVWSATSQPRASCKHVELVAGSAFWYFTYSTAGDDNYLEVTVEKRRVDDGTLVWTHPLVAKVHYGWFSTKLSANGDLLYLWPNSQGSWMVALNTSDAT